MPSAASASCAWNCCPRRAPISSPRPRATRAASLNGLELAALTTPPDAEGLVRIDAAAIEECVQKKRVLYDRDEDQHYDTISAFIKSVRGSDPDAALYWLAKMIEAGEDPRFIARRLVILASEDIGLADPQGLGRRRRGASRGGVHRHAGGPHPLAEATLYLACAPKSNSSVMGIGEAHSAVQKNEVVQVPKHLRDAHYPGAKKLGHGEDYQYSHEFPRSHRPGPVLRHRAGPLLSANRPRL